MKYVLLTLAALLAILGGWSIYSGYPIIDLERGWASVISGTVALTGGIITLALAFVLASLDRLRQTLIAQETCTSVAAQPDLPAAPSPPPAMAPAAPLFGKREQEPRPFELLRKPVVETAPPEEEPAADTPPMPFEEAGPLEPSAPEPEMPEPKPFSRVASAFTSAATKAREERRMEPSIGELWRRVGVNLDAPFGKNAEPPERKEEPDESEAGIPRADWLDEALAKFDADTPDEAPVEEPPPLAPHSPPEQPGEPDVIGRYQAEGTSYIMYADGSIEAQSEQGVMRFGSMAELKAFFER